MGGSPATHGPGLDPHRHDDASPPVPDSGHRGSCHLADDTAPSPEDRGALHGAATVDERRNVAILATNQALFLIAAVTVMTLSGLVGQRLTPNPALATLPVAMMMVGVVVAALPASLLMKRVGRSAGFLVGALLGGAGGGVVSILGIASSSFWLFSAGNLLLGVYQAFANYHRFAAADTASPAFQNHAISLVLAGGVAAAFLGPLNASRTNELLTITDAGPYAVIVVLALVGAGLHLGLRIPGEDEARTGHQRRLRDILAQPAVLVAMATATFGYAILVMTATPLAMQASGFGLPQAATVMQWHVLGMFVPSFFTGHLIARFGHTSVLVGWTRLNLSLLPLIGLAAAATWWWRIRSHTTTDTAAARSA